MVESPQPMSLEESASRCLKSLQALKKDAEEQFHPTTSTRSLLQNFEQSIDGSFRILQAWIKDFRKERQTNDDEIIIPVRQVFRTLEQHIEDVDIALSARLRLRYGWFAWVSLRRKKKKKKLEANLNTKLQNISDTLGELNKQLKVLLVDSSKQSNRQIKKQDVLEGINQADKRFREFFNKHSNQEGQHFRSLALGLLWEHIPNIEDLDGKVGNAEDPGDGRMYSNEEVTKTTSVLKTLYQVWLEAGKSAPPRNLREMAKICLVLAGIKQPELLEDFIDSDIVDKHLGTLQKERVQTILKSHHAECARAFIVEQYRAVPRDWKEGDHVEFEEDEPLPLIPEHTYKNGSSGLVSRVRDYYSHDIYALKKQIIANDENRTAAARRHLEEETKRLKELRHLHVVRLVKSFERGGAYGLILIPAATSDLEGLLGRYDKDRYNATTKSRDREWLRPILLTAFGCLSKGLAYIHGCAIRHRDVKPGNILYERDIPNVNKGARFLWADFGSAYDFSASQDSQTRSSNFHSPRYAAPEIADNRRPYSGRLNRIGENGVESIDQELDREPVEDMPDSHGRKTDIFSLGCVFFELLRALVDKKLPLDVPSSQHPNEVPIFARYIPELTTWAKQQQLQESDSGRELAALFKLATEMISRNPKSRPAVDDVVKRVAAVGSQYFCEECRVEHTAQDKPDQTQVLRRLGRAATTLVHRRPAGGVLNRVNSLKGILSW